MDATDNLCMCKGVGAPLSGHGEKVEAATAGGERADEAALPCHTPRTLRRLATLSSSRKRRGAFAPTKALAAEKEKECRGKARVRGREAPRLRSYVAALSRRGNFHPGRTKWHVYPVG